MMSANISRSDLSGATLIGSNLDGMNVSHCRFIGSKITGGHQGPPFGYRFFMESIFIGTDFTDADILDKDLCAMDNAFFHTTMPDGITKINVIYDR